MKKLLFTIYASSFCFSILAQNTFPDLGNVGIGTTIPHVLLSVGPVSASPFNSSELFQIGKNNDAYMTIRDGVANALFGTSYGLPFIGSQSESDFTIRTANNERVRITKTGQVGIGTTVPQEILEIMSSNPIITFHNPSTSSFKVGNDGEVFKIAAMDNGFGGHAGDFWNNDSQVIAMKKNGNVGIGTDNPDAKLAVKGDIHTQEVKVDLNGAVTPDFVFENDYELRTLEQLETFVKANKHLPEIPSGTEMVESGFKLKEMNLKLLQKVEELTLYLIDQNEKIKALEQKVKQLENR